MNHIDKLRRRFTSPASTSPADAPSGARHETIRMRHETKRRSLTVTRLEHLTPRMLRIHFASPELAGFVSAALDDHIKLVFPSPAGDKPLMRDFTPRAFDRAAGILTIDFALHDAGPATEWAAGAKIGDRLEIGGPRGSRITPDDFDWYLLIGDESALPAIGRRVEELRPGVPVTTLVAVVHPYEEQRFKTQAAWTPIWLARGEPSEDDAKLLRDRLAGLALPPGDGYVWIAGEASIVRTLRDHMIDERGHPKAWLKASGYWQRGQSDAHVEIGD
jgi:NADPH-dependent ferric siderophore reductase